MGWPGLYKPGVGANGLNKMANKVFMANLTFHKLTNEAERRYPTTKNVGKFFVLLCILASPHFHKLAT